MPASTHFLIEQALFGLAPGPSYAQEDRAIITTWARSDGFRDDWLPLAAELMHGFGEQPAGVACPLAIFAQPFGNDHVAVVQVTDRGAMSPPREQGTVEKSEYHGSLAFHFLIVPLRAYAQFLGDPFFSLPAAAFPLHGSSCGPLPTHSWPAIPLPERTVGEVQQVSQETAQVGRSASRERKRPESGRGSGG